MLFTIEIKIFLSLAAATLDRPAGINRHKSINNTVCSRAIKILVKNKFEQQNLLANKFN